MDFWADNIKKNIDKYNDRMEAINVTNQINFYKSRIAEFDAELTKLRARMVKYTTMISKLNLAIESAEKAEGYVKNAEQILREGYQSEAGTKKANLLSLQQGKIKSDVTARLKNALTDAQAKMEKLREKINSLTSQRSACQSQLNNFLASC